MLRSPNHFTLSVHIMKLVVQLSGRVYISYIYCHQYQNWLINECLAHPLFLLKLTPTVSNVLISKSFLPKCGKWSAKPHLMERGKYLILFSSIIFLLFENFIMNPQHPHFPVLLHLSPTLGSSPQKKTNKKKNKFSLCFPCTHRSMVKLPVARPLQKAESFSFCTLARSHQLWRATFQHPYHNF